ncbi:hypothetical protein I3760_12G002100 [Carya illinoinensis]|nr:hypothetical protein I3760_12G002100 [Carya illinoinensis]
MKAREHIKDIRRQKFSIGGELNPLTEDLQQAVKNLSAKLYAKDVHFLMELIQNAEDNEYMERVGPSLEFMITSADITGTGAPSALLIFNNEKGFSSKNIDSICSVRYIGEKGIGFKSVFLITTQTYIFSTGYHIRFNEEPCTHCKLGYIVPEWVEENPTFSNLQQINGSKTSLPTTTIVLPLKSDKWFLVREHNKDPKYNTISAIAITSETNYVSRKNINAESSTLHLSAERKITGSDVECNYYMWKQKFPVRHENREERRMEVEELVITLTFPLGERLNRGTSSPGIYAFLPIEMVTNLPFIIQADLLLHHQGKQFSWTASGTKGFLTNPSSWASMFRFIPLNNSSYQGLKKVRNSIKEKLVKENIVPCTQQKFFHKPCEVGRLMPAFRNILEKVGKEGKSLLNLSSHGNYILSPSLDKGEYDHVLSFLGVEPVNNEWYAECIQSSNLVVGVAEDVYLEILLFVAENWKSKLDSTRMKNIPLIKYVDVDGDVYLCTIDECRNSYKLVFSSKNFDHSSWLINWNWEFLFVANHFLMLESTKEAIQFFPKKLTLQKWLQEHVKVGVVDVYDYAVHINNYINKDSKLAIAFVHFFYHSYSKNDHGNLIKQALVDNYGNLIRQKTGVMVPAKLSKWAGLIGSNPWRRESYVELGEEYLCPDSFVGESCSGEQILEFLKTHVAASDIPYIAPPNVAIPAVFALLTKQNAFLLLDWIHNMICWRTYIPQSFLESIKEGSWLKITTNGYSSYMPPSRSFMLPSLLGNILQSGLCGEACEFIGKHLMSLADSSTLTRSKVFSVLNFIKKERRWVRTSSGDMSPVGSILFDHEWEVASQISNLPFIDTGYFGDEIFSYKEELRSLGVLIGSSGIYKFIVDNLKSPSCFSSLTAEAIIFILECMRHSRQSGKLIRTLSGEDFSCLTQWACILHVDADFYGGNTFLYKNELLQLGVKMDFEEAVEVLVQSFKQQVASMTKENVLFFLSCYRLLNDTPHKFPLDLRKLVLEVKWLRTRLGDHRSPSNCILYGPDWQSIAPIALLPFVDDSDNYYGKDIHEYKKELKGMGIVTEFKDGVKFIADGLFFPLDPSITHANVVAMLECIHILLHDHVCYKFPDTFWKIISQKWLKTNDGYRPPDQCLFGPFLDEDFYGSNIRKYKNELNYIHVTVDVMEGCSLVARHLDFHHEFSTIVRIYNYLSEFNWDPDTEAAKRIWIPNGTEDGKWAKPREASNVKNNPSIDDYCQLWKVWESSRPQLSHEDCFKFWVYVSKHWSGKIERTLIDSLGKLPVASDSDGILLSDKHDVFIADDVLLKDLFEQPSLPRTKLLEKYRKLGVWTISESVKKEEASMVDVGQLNQVNPMDILIEKGLVRLILGFLADPMLKMEAERRHEAIGILNVTFLEIVEPIAVKYSLSLSLGEIMELKVSQMIRWDRVASKLFSQKLDRSGGYKKMIEYATYFSKAISEGLLWENSDHIGALFELIKWCFILEFNEEAVGFVMKSKNMRIFKEEEEFLASIVTTTQEY